MYESPEPSKQQTLWNTVPTIEKLRFTMKHPLQFEEILLLLKITLLKIM